MNDKTTHNGRFKGKTIMVYAHYSTDKHNNPAERTQEQRCRAYIHVRGGTVENVLTDLTGAGVDRPQFMRMLAAIRNGRVDIVIAEDKTRLERDMGKWLKFQQLCHENAVTVMTCDGRA